MRPHRAAPNAGCVDETAVTRNNCLLERDSVYRRPKFLEVLLDIRCQMALEADYDVDLFAQNARGNEGECMHRTRLQDPDVASEQRRTAWVSDLIKTREG